MRKKRALAPVFGVALAAAFPAVAAGQAHFLRGDANHDRRIDVSDSVYTLLSLFAGGRAPPCEDAADVDDTGEIDLNDPVSLLRHMFLGGPGPARPFPAFEADPTPDTLACLPERPGPVAAGGSELAGDIAVDLTLRPDKTYRLVSGVFVKEGAALTLEPGVTVLGDSATRAYLVVERGARIVAAGTPTHPVVFTSDRPPGERSRADWGGILVLGRGPSDVPGGEWEVKGFRGVWAGGGSNPEPGDASGRLSYVRIEYTGAEVAPGVPLSAIAFFAVGRGTQLDHLEAKYGNDDGIEWYGGTCDLRYGLSVGMGDEGFDCQFGWQGRGQFLACLQSRDAGNHGFQDGDSPAAQPLTLPMLSNVTLAGAWSPGSRSAIGLYVRRTAGVVLTNALIQGWQEVGLEFGQEIGPVTVDHSAFFDNGVTCSCASGAACPCPSLFAPPFDNIEAGASLLVDPGNLEAPDLRGVASELPEPYDPAGLDPWFDPAPYAGAVPPEGQGEDWTRARWISWTQR